jgi:short-subunit dehydrogenase
VVGASSGIGEAIARELGRRGSRVALVARRSERLDEIRAEIDAQAGEQRALVFTHDVADVGAVPSLFQEIATRLGGLELVVYSAGVMPPVALDEFPTEKDLGTVQANLSGAIAWLNSAADRFSRARAGTIIGISSVAGDRGRVGNPVYNATKAALSTYLEALRNRLARKGVTVLTAKPGYVRTALIDGAPLPRFVPVISPKRAADQILAAAAAGDRVVYVPGWWRLVMTAVRAIPAPLLERINV